MKPYIPLTVIDLSNNRFTSEQYPLEWPWELSALVSLFQVCPDLGDYARYDDIACVRKDFDNLTSREWVGFFWRLRATGPSDTLSDDLFGVITRALSSEIIRNPKETLTLLRDLCEDPVAARYCVILIRTSLAIRIPRPWSAPWPESDESVIAMLLASARAELGELLSKCVKLMESLDPAYKLDQVHVAPVFEPFGLGHLLDIDNQSIPHPNNLG